MPVAWRHAMAYPSRCAYGLIDWTFAVASIKLDVPELRRGAYLVLVAGLVPWAVLALIGRGRPYDLGFRKPNLYGWRIILLGFLISLPFLVWMVHGKGFGTPYLAELERAGTVAFVLYYLANMTTEHFLLHGVLLAVCRVGQKWPPPAPVRAVTVARLGRVLNWVGLAQPTGSLRGPRRLTRWMGLPDGCVAAILVSTILFGLVHLGKDPRELTMSLPGGLALAWIAYRTNTWLTTLILHLATAGTTCLMIVALN